LPGRPLGVENIPLSGPIFLLGNSAQVQGLANTNLWAKYGPWPVSVQLINQECFYILKGFSKQNKPNKNNNNDQKTKNM